MSPAADNSIAAVLRRRASTQGADSAFAFRPDRGDEELSLTYARLDVRATTVAAHLLRDCAPQDRAVLLFPPGLEVIAAFFGCLYAGLIAVPMALPRRLASRDSSAEILADCAPRHVLTLRSVLEALRPEIAQSLQAGRRVICLDELESEELAELRPPGELAVLQYTSGSTGAPKGVMVSHANVLANLEMIRRALGTDATSGFAGWLPFHHDMGLFMTVLQPLYVGAPSVFMPPAAFMQRPLNWLRAIHQKGAQVAAAPNFAFELCVERFKPDAVEGLDLSNWRIAFNAAEPIRPDTMDRFAQTFAPYGFDRSAFYAAYGLAEATLIVTGGSGPRGPRDATVDGAHAVSCGHAVAGAAVAVVDPDSRARRPAGKTGEVWVRGPAVTQGYWNKADVNTATFDAQITDEPGAGWLRTGDLGVLDASGELFITGRLKDLIIVRGANHYPQDIEATVQGLCSAFKRGAGVAFLAPDANGDDRLVIVQEIDRAHRRDFDAATALGDIREAVANEHELSVHAVALIRQGTLPLTTSGKLRRNMTRTLWLEQKLETADQP